MCGRRLGVFRKKHYRCTDGYTISALSDGYTISALSEPMKNGRTLHYLLLQRVDCHAFFVCSCEVVDATLNLAP